MTQPPAPQPKTMYRARNFAPFVEALPVVKETASTVVLIGNRKEAKLTAFHDWFDTEEAAWEWCFACRANEVESALMNLERAELREAEVKKAYANRRPA